MQNKLKYITAQDLFGILKLSKKKFNARSKSIERRNARLQRKYVLSTWEDLDILTKVTALEKKQLSKSDAEIIALIKTQLKRNWRKHLLKKLDKLLKEYAKS